MIRNVNRTLLALGMAASLACTSMPAFATATSIAEVDTPEKYLTGYSQENCIDVSVWNGIITEEAWENMQDQGIRNVFLRAGYSTLDSGGNKEDSVFRSNIKSAYEAGMNIGVYYFCAALDEEEARAEAEYFTSLISEYTNIINLPVVMDFESNEKGRVKYSTLLNLGTEKCTAICRAFCDVIKDAGYDPMIYANRSTLENCLDTDSLEKDYKIWLAQYPEDNDGTTYDGEYAAWQYSSSVRIDGLTGRVDASYIYVPEEKQETEDEEIAENDKETEKESSKDNTEEKTGEYVNNPGKVKVRNPVKYRLSEGVSVQIPEESDDAVSTAKVTNKAGITHGYKIYEKGDYGSDECALATILSGFFVSESDIDPAYVRDSVLPGVFGEEYDKAMEDSMSLSCKGICDVLTELEIDAEYVKKIDDKIYVNIKKNLAAGNPVIISISGNSKWGKRPQTLLLIGMDEDGNGILADCQDRTWGGTSQRIKTVSVDKLVKMMKDGRDDTFTNAQSGGYVLIHENNY